MNAPFLAQRPTVCSAIASLAFAVAEHARSKGLAVVFVRASKVYRSASRHIVLRDRAGRHWLLRISDHDAPPHTGYDRPHFDLVTVNGTIGAERIYGFVNQISRGEVVWTEPERTRRRKGQRTRGQR